MQARGTPVRSICKRRATKLVARCQRPLERCCGAVEPAAGSWEAGSGSAVEGKGKNEGRVVVAKMESRKGTMPIEMYHDETVYEEKENIDPETGKMEGVRTRTSTGASVTRAGTPKGQRSPLLDITKATNMAAEAAEDSKKGKTKSKNVQAYFTGHVAFQSTRTSNCQNTQNERRGPTKASSLR